MKSNSASKLAANFEVLFCANDEMAIGVIKYCNESGGRRETMKIIGFDNIQLAATSNRRYND